MGRPYIILICQMQAIYNLSHVAEVTDPTHNDITNPNKRLKWQLNNISCGLIFARLAPTFLKIVAFTDSFFTNNRDLSSQIGYIIYLANAFHIANILYSSSIKYKRITRSVLAGELHGMAHDFDLGAVTKAMISKML